MSSNVFVRQARAADSADVARIQVACWRSTYSGHVPDAVLAELTSPQAQERWGEEWGSAITNPPTGRHRVLVAVDTDPDAGRLVAGFISFGPATDQDRWPQTDAELYELHVAPDMTRRGHGSRLLNAVADTLREDGFHTGCVWTLESDAVRQRFLRSAGWEPDGALRKLDMGSPVPLIRLQTLIAR